MNSRKYYEGILKVKVPKDFDVHHIDCNNKNNDIRNLVALPKDIHARYHASKNQFNVSINSHNLELHFDTCNKGLYYYLKSMDCMNKSLSECFNYIAYRDYLLGEKPLVALTISKPY